MVASIANFRVFSSLDLRSAYHQVSLLPQDREFTAFEACGRLFQFKRIPFGLRNSGAVFQRIMDNFIRDSGLSGVFCYVDNLYICGMTQVEHDHNLARLLEAAKRVGLTFNEGKTVLSTTSLNILGYTIRDGSIVPDQERVQPLLELPIPANSAALK
jgi:hypothetical protein